MLKKQDLQYLCGTCVVYLVLTRGIVDNQTIRPSASCLSTPDKPAFCPQHSAKWLELEVEQGVGLPRVSCKLGTRTKLPRALINAGAALHHGDHLILPPLHPHRMRDA